MWIYAALIMGLAGSLHCAGMCGPIALLISASGNGKRSVSGALLYNSGRIVSYAVFGSLSGLAGGAMLFFGGQQWLSIVAGIVILIALILSRYHIPALKKASAPFSNFIRTKLSGVIRNRKPGSMLTMGILNGLLPCGLVYAAIGGAAATGSVLNGALFMAVFGASTLPVMFTLSLVGTRLSPTFQHKLVKAVPYTIAIMALLLIVRGMGLGIPYLSPEIVNEHLCCCHMKN